MPAQSDLKVVLLGHTSVGKSCLSNRFANDKFIPSGTMNATIGTAYMSKEVTVGNKKIVLGIWDTAGSERYDAMTKLYYRGAQAAVVCYDVTTPKTFKKVKYWINELRNVEDSCKIYVCATKKDLFDGDGDTLENLEKVETYASSVSAKFFFTSSKTGENVAELFQTIAVDCAPLIKSKQNGRRTGEELIRLSTDVGRSNCCYSSSGN